jgi:hypothetical protein
MNRSCPEWDITSRTPCRIRLRREQPLIFTSSGRADHNASRSAQGGGAGRVQISREGCHQPNIGGTNALMGGKSTNSNHTSALLGSQIENLQFRFYKILFWSTNRFTTTLSPERRSFGHGEHQMPIPTLAENMSAVADRHGVMKQKAPTKASRG